MYNRDCDFSLFERAGLGRSRNVSFAAIESRGLQDFGLHRSGSAGSKVQAQDEILFQVFVQDNEAAAWEFGSVGGRVDSRRLQL